MKKWVTYFFLDASAIVKLVSNEAGSDNLKRLFNSSALFCTTRLSIAEAYGVLKRKWCNKQSTDKGYLNRMYLLNSYMGHRIKFVEGSLETKNDFNEAEELFKKYSKESRNKSIDLSDALQIVAMKNNFFSKMRGESKPVLVTADESLERAAREEGLKVWNCNKTAEPPIGENL